MRAPLAQPRVRPSARQGSARSPLPPPAPLGALVNHFIRRSAGKRDGVFIVHEGRPQKETDMNFQRVRKASLILAASFAFALPATAGGLFEAPDGVGNPSGADYTGYYPIAYFFGIRDNATQHTRIACTNVSGVVADVLSVQFFNHDTINPSAPPTGDLSMGSLGLADLDHAASTAASGTAPDLGVARVVVRDSVRKHNVAAYCTAFVEDLATGRTVATIDSWSPPARKKKKRR